MNRQQALFIVVADIILLAVIVFLVVLALDKDFVLSDKVKDVTKKHFQKADPKNQEKEPVQTGAFFLRAEANTLLKNGGEPFNPHIKVRGSSLFMNTANGSSYRFDTKANAITGRADSSFTKVSSLVPFKKNFLFMDMTGRFYTLVTRNMTIIPYFYYSAGGQVLDFPALADMDRDGILDLVFPDSFSKIICLNGKSFSPNWIFQDSSDIVCRSPAIMNINSDSHPDVAFIGKDGVLYAVDGKSGWVLWKAPLQQEVSSPLYVEDVNRDGFMEILFVSDAGMLFCFTHLGTLLWQIPLEDKCHPEIVFADVNGDRIKDVILSLINGKIVAFSGISKMRLWDFQAEGASIRFAITAYDADKDGTVDIVFADDTPALYVVQGTTGKELGRLPLARVPSSSLVSLNSRCYFLSDDNNLHTIRFVVNK